MSLRRGAERRDTSTIETKKRKKRVETKGRRKQKEEKGKITP